MALRRGSDKIDGIKRINYETHPHFNQSAPARGNPWQHPTYDGVMKDVKYGSLNFPVSYQYCLGRVLELYTHPGTTFEHLSAFVQVFENEYSILKEGGLREDW